MVVGQEYYLCKLVFDDVATTGSGSCDGCAIGIDIDFAKAVIYATEGPTRTITDPATRSHITWQGGVVPTINRTWGGIKRLYH